MTDEDNLKGKRNKTEGEARGANTAHGREIGHRAKMKKTNKHTGTS